jgi:hypothetical protein
MLDLLQDVTSLTTLITLKTDGDDARKPSFSINRPVPISACVSPASHGPRIHFAGAGPAASRWPPVEGQCRSD